MELKQRKPESSGSEIDEDILKPPGERGKDKPVLAPSSASASASVEDPTPSTQVDTTVQVNPPTPSETTHDGDRTLTEQDVHVYDYPSPPSPTTAEHDRAERSPSFPNYANLEFAQINNLLSQASKPSIPGEEENVSPKSPKKPMPLQRKNKTAPAQSGAEEVSKPLESPVRNPIPKKPAPPAKPPKLLNQEPDSPLDVPKIQHTSTPSSSTRGTSKPLATLPALSKFLAANEGRARDDSQVNTGPSAPLPSTKPRSHTTVEQSSIATPTLSGDKKQPILPPAMRYRSKSRSPSPGATPDSSQVLQLSKAKSEDERNIIVLAPAPALGKKPILKTQISEPSLTKNRPLAPSAPTTNRANKPTTTSYGSKFPRLVGAGATGSGERNNLTSPTDGSERDELMKKLTLRRKRIDEQLASTKASTDAVTVAKTSSPAQKPSPPSQSPKAPHRISTTLSHKSQTAVGNSSVCSSSERNSTVSTSSSEVVVAYRRLDESPSMTSLSSNGTSHSMEVGGGGGSGSGVLLRKSEDGGENKETNLTKYGIIEEGGSYVI